MSCEIEEHPAGCECHEMSMSDLVLSGDDRDWPRGGDKCFRDDWRAAMLALEPAGAVLCKARDFCVFYFDSDRPTMHTAASAYGIERKTAAAHMRRCREQGWIDAGASPLQIGKTTPRRIYLRRMFWEVPRLAVEGRPGGQFGKWLEPYGEPRELSSVTDIASSEKVA